MTQPNLTTGCGACPNCGETQVLLGGTFRAWHCSNCHKGGFDPVPLQCPNCKTKPLVKKVLHTPDFCACPRCGRCTPPTTATLSAPTKEELDALWPDGK